MRMLIVGNPGSGKTSLVAHLLDAGRAVTVADFDGNTLPIFSFAKDTSKLTVWSLQDSITFDPATMLPRLEGGPKAFPRFIEELKKFQPQSPKDFLVIDSLSSLGYTIIAYSQFVNGRDGKQRHPREYGDAAIRLEGTIAMLCRIPCHVIVLAHFMRLTPPMDLGGQSDRDEEPAVGDWFHRYPNVFGRAMPPRIGAWFPIQLQAAVQGEGPGAKYVLKLTPDADFETKCPVPKGKFPAVLEASKFIQLIETLEGGINEQTQ